MRRLRALALVLAAVGGLFGLTIEPTRQAEGGSLQATTSALPAPPAAAVAVEHELVTAELVNPAPRPREIRPFAPLPSRRTTLQATAQKPWNPTILNRTRRALLGDGRHKPQPFPRINHN